MRRIAPLAVLAVPLVSTLVGCDDTAAPPASADTVAVGDLPGTLPTASTEPTASARRTASTASPDPGASTASTDRPQTSRSDVSAPPGGTVFVELLAGTLDGDAEGDPASWRPVVDDTRRLRLAVPATWTEGSTAPATDGGAAVPSLSAAPELAAFLDGFDAPGLTAVVVDDDPEDALRAYDFGEDCGGDAVAPLRGGGPDGAYQVWRDCGGTGSAIVTVALRPGGAEATVLLLAQLVDLADAAALDHALSTLTLRD